MGEKDRAPDLTGLTGDDFLWAATRLLHYGGAQQFFEMTYDGAVEAHARARPARRARAALSIRAAKARRKGKATR